MKKGGCQRDIWFAWLVRMGSRDGPYRQAENLATIRFAGVFEEVWQVAGRVVPMRVGGVELLVEASPVAGSEPTSMLGRAQEAVADAFERAQTAIVAVASSTVDVIAQMEKRAVRPDQVEVTFGLKFSAQGNVIMAGACGEATLEVKLLYQHNHGPEAGSAAATASG